MYLLYSGEIVPTIPSSRYVDIVVKVTNLFQFQPSKVQVEVYYETLCPDTRYFIRQQLYPVWQDLKHIMDIHWKPYGKATVSKLVPTYKKVVLYVQFRYPSPKLKKK